VVAAEDRPVQGISGGQLHARSPHGLGRRPKEVTPARPVLHLCGVHQTHIRLVDQGSSPEFLAGRFPGQPPGGEPAELAVDQRQELLGGVGVALLDGGLDAGDCTHGGTARSETPAESLRSIVEQGPESLASVRV
jgi:hypothetical protein